MSNTELTIIDDIKNDVIVGNNNQVPMASIFGRGVSTKQESFGGKSLTENAIMVDKALQNTWELQEIYNHSHSEWVWKHAVLNWVAPGSNIRQIAAEMQRKRSALNEAKWRQVKNEIKLRKLEDKLAAGNFKDDWEEIEIKAKICELKEGITEGTTYIEGAMKDVLMLNDMYEQLKAQVEGYNEVELNKLESKNNLSRSIIQCIRDIRQYGSITKGEQEYLEQIGVNPSKMNVLLRKYVEEEVEEEAWDTTCLIQFVRELVEDLIENKKVDVAKLNAFNYKVEPTEEFGYQKRIAEKK